MLGIHLVKLALDIYGSQGMNHKDFSDPMTSILLMPGQNIHLYKRNMKIKCEACLYIYKANLFHFVL